MTVGDLSKALSVKNYRIRTDFWAKVTCHLTGLRALSFWLVHYLRRFGKICQNLKCLPKLKYANPLIHQFYVVEFILQRNSVGLDSCLCIPHMWIRKILCIRLVVVEIRYNSSAHLFETSYLHVINWGRQFLKVTAFTDSQDKALSEKGVQVSVWFGLSPRWAFWEKIMKSFISRAIDLLSKTYILIGTGCAAAALAGRPGREELGQHSRSQGSSGLVWAELIRLIKR